MNAKTYVYWNLHKNCFSFRRRGLVYKHLEKDHSVTLCSCDFKVSEKGRQRVLKEKRKNVHAFIAAGMVLDIALPDVTKYAEVTYNPYKYATFVRKDTGEPIYGAAYVILRVVDKKPKIYAYVG